MLALDLDKDQEAEIIQAFDPQDSSEQALEGTPSLIYSSIRSLRQHRADVFDDDIIDLHDALAVLAQFGEPQPSVFKQVQVDPTGATTALDLILATDPVMEARGSDSTCTTPSWWSLTARTASCGRCASRRFP